MIIDHETRAGRFLASMDLVTDLLGNTVPGAEFSAVAMSQLLALLSDEAKVVVTPFRAGGANDDDC